MMKIFNSVGGYKPKRSVFDLSHERKFSMNMGELIPILCEEILPGDKFKLNTEVLMRLAPLVSPVMHRVNVYTHFFFVPTRLVWDEFKDFITGGVNGTSQPVVPNVSINSAQPTHLSPGSLADYMGVATNRTGTSSGFNYTFTTLPFRAYQLIYNEYYRDQTLSTAVPISKASGADVNSIAMLTKRSRSWEKDYFTSALPWTQRGGDVTVPFGGEVSLKDPMTGDPAFWVNKDTGTPLGGPGAIGYSSTGESVVNSTATSAVYDPNGTLEVAQGTTTIEDLRRATKLQQWLERNARGGSRYIEQVLSHFGVQSSDARLQRPEFLGGGKSPVVISEVLQTSSTDATTPQANMAGHGMSVGNTHSFKKYFEEHGYLIGIMSVLPRTAYQDGTRRMFLRSDKMDYYWPEFAQLGEQPVYKDEIYSTFNDAVKKDTFGYQSRYCEYKYIPSSVHGDFKNSLSFWHMGRIFASEPALNESFIKADPTHRVFAVTDPAKAKLYVQLFNAITAVRPIPYDNIPSLF